MLIPTHGCVFRLSSGGRKELASLFLELAPNIPASPPHVLRLVNTSPSHTPQAFFKVLLLHYISMGLFVVLSF